jgi:hypothetical protein
MGRVPLGAWKIITFIVQCEGVMAAERASVPKNARITRGMRAMLPELPRVTVCFRNQILARHSNSVSK